MTDTARTVAALKALMPDNTDGEITPQTERDLLESLANPVAPELGRVSRYYSSTASPQSVASGVHLFPDYRQTWTLDPLAIQGVGDYVSTLQSQTYTAGSWWALPRGLWMINISAVWDTNTAGTRRDCYVEWIDNRLATPGWDAYIGDPNYEYSAPTTFRSLHPATMPRLAVSGNLAQIAFLLMPVTDAMCAGGDNAKVGVSMLQDSGTNRTLTASDVYIWRIADWSGGAAIQ